MKSDFCAENIKKQLPEGFEGLIFLDETDSTNEFCKREMLESGTFVVAAAQSGGRGRLGRSFESKAGGIFLSLTLRPRIPTDRLMCITGMAAVAALRAIEETTGEKCNVKWINDILLNGKKIGGILTEVQFEGSTAAVIIGIGINGNNPASDFAWDTEGKAGSILTETDKETDLSKLAAALIEKLSALANDLEAGNISPYIETYRERCSTLGREVTLTWREVGSEFLQVGERKAGYVEEIDHAFGLVVRYPDGKSEIIRSGEVCVRGKNGEY